MIDAMLKIIEKLTQLATIREKNRQLCFKEYVEPMLVSTEVVLQDYTALLAQLAQKLRDGESSEEILIWANQRRDDARFVREKLRALIRKKMLRSKYFGLFEIGIWGILTGRVVESGKLSDDYLRESGQHTLLDTIYHVTHQARGESVFEHRQRCQQYIDRQRDKISKSWSLVVNAYAEMKAEVLPR